MLFSVVLARLMLEIDMICWCIAAITLLLAVMSIMVAVQPFILVTLLVYGAGKLYCQVEVASLTRYKNATSLRGR